MRAMVFDRYSEPDVTGLREVPVPEPRDGEVLICVGYSGVNPADSKTRSGATRAHYRYVNLPLVTGIGAAGVVERTDKLHIAQQALASLLTLVLLFAVWPQSLVAQAPPGPLQVPPAPPHMQLTPEEMQQFVAPIALYPDSLVAQILATSTFPEQVVDADRWVQSHPDLKGEDLA